MLDVAPPRRPGMEVDRREIGGPRDLRELGDAELVGGAARREGDGRGLDPVGPLLRHALLVDRLALGAVRVPLQLRRPLVERPHDALADGEVVVHEVELRLAARGEEDLVRIRHLDGARPDLELDERRRPSQEYRGFRVRRHAASPSRPSSRSTTTSSSSRRRGGRDARRADPPGERARRDAAAASSPPSAPRSRASSPATRCSSRRRPATTCASPAPRQKVLKRENLIARILD